MQRFLLVEYFIFDFKNLYYAKLLTFVPEN